MPARRACEEQGKEEKEGEAAVNDEELDKVVQLMESREFGEAAKKLNAMLARNPKDTLLMHNLGVIYTEQGLFHEAEEVFLRAYDAQKAEGKVNYSTMFGLATVMTEQGEGPKLMQAEALFHDYLEKAISQEEKGVVETFMALDGLAQNLERQKRWMEAAEARRGAAELGSRLFGEQSEKTTKLKTALARAERLSRWQWGIRMLLWGATVAAPIVMGIIWHRSSLPGWGASGAVSANSTIEATAEPADL